MEMLEREVELGRLTSLLADAADGSGRVVLIRGEAGIGKTTLVDSFRATVGDETTFLIGACDDLMTPREFGPLWDMATEEVRLAAALGSGDRSRIYQAAVELMSRDRRSMVLVIEDVQWADAATLDLIKILGRRIDRSSSLLLITYRDEELDSDHRLRFVIGDLAPSAVDRISLGPLSADAVARLAAVHGRERDFLLAETGGNPLYLSELLSSRDGTVPVSIQDATRRRIARLSPVSRELIELISVVPGDAHRSLVEHITEWSVAIDEAVQRGVLRFDGNRISFTHELVRRAVEATLPPARRQRLNAQVLSEMIARGEAPAQIVQHAVEAADEQAIVDFAPAAARQAIAVQSYAEAVSHYRQLKNCLDHFNPTERAQLLESWSFAAQVEGHVAESLDGARSAVVLWRDADDPVSLGRSLRLQSRVAWSAGEQEEAERAATEAISVLEHAGNLEELAFAYSASAQLDMLAFEFDRAIAKSDTAIDLAQTVEADAVEVHARINKGSALSLSGRPNGDETLASAIDLAATIRAAEEQTRGIVNQAWAALEQRRLASAMTAIDRALATATQNNLASFELYAEATKGLISLFTGDWFAVEDLAPNLARMDWGATGRIVVLTAVGTVRARRGSPDAGELLSEAWQLAQRSGELLRTGYAAAALAELAWIEDELDRVGPLVEPLLDHARRVGVEWIAGTLAYWSWKSGAPVGPLTSVSPPHAAQIAGDWRAAATGWGRLRMPYERALSLSEGDATARVEALKAMDELGADAVAAKLRRQLRTDGVRNVPRGPRKATRAHRAGLTERQSEVLELVAEGLSNRDIADRLFVSPRTVDQHVSAILAKLAVTSRGEAVAAGHEMGVLSEG